VATRGSAAFWQNEEEKEIEKEFLQKPPCLFPVSVKQLKQILFQFLFKILQKF